VLKCSQVVTQAVGEEREKNGTKKCSGGENRVIRWIKKGKSLDDIMDFSFLPQERVQQLFKEHKN
jgi:hypothetical protein